MAPVSSLAAPDYACLRFGAVELHHLYDRTVIALPWLWRLDDCASAGSLKNQRVFRPAAKTLVLHRQALISDIPVPSHDHGRAPGTWLTTNFVRIGHLLRKYDRGRHCAFQVD